MSFIISRTLNKLREELNQYAHKEALWPRMQAELLRTIKSAEEYGEYNYLFVILKFVLKVLYNMCYNSRFYSAPHKNCPYILF